MSSIENNIVGKKEIKPTLWLLPYHADQIDPTMLQNQLAENQRLRFDNLKNKRKIEFGITRLFLMQCLKRFLHERFNYQTKTIEIIEQENSPPKINIDKRINLRFSISHSKNLIAILISEILEQDCDWGLDIEQCRLVKNSETAMLFCNTNQLVTLKKTKSYEEHYYRFWTQKEAILKAKRSGITDTELKTIEGVLSSKSQPLRSTVFFNPIDSCDYMISAFCRENTSTIDCQLVTLDKELRFSTVKPHQLSWQYYQLKLA